MRTSAFLVSVLHLAATITVIRHTHSIKPGARFSIGSVEITCDLNDILVITAPESNSEHVLYYLTEPGGDSTRLNITKQDYCFDKYEMNYEVKRKTKKPSVSRRIHYEVFKTNYYDGEKHDIVSDLVGKKLGSINSNEFAIGPLLPENHGNWVLSVYVKDEATTGWVEFFLVISVIIIEKIPTFLKPDTVSEGSDMNLSFAYPINEIETCELTPPKTTFERHFERKRLNSCYYVVKNATVNDSGLWKITGVGRIVYTAEINLKVVK